MSLLTTHEEYIILDEILPHLLLSGKFNVRDIHEEKVVIPANTKDEKVNLEEVKKIVAVNYSQYFYDNITAYLIENRFAKKVNEDRDFLVLTHKGEYLSAYEKLRLYNAEFGIEVNENEIIDRVSLLIQNISFYGEFCLIPPKRKDKQVLINFDIPNDSQLSQKLNDALAKQKNDVKSDLIEEHKLMIRDEKVLQYLVDEGFAINRHDIKVEDNIYRQLTDKGRKLKELGSIAAYFSYVKECEKKVANQIAKDENLYWIQLWIAVGAVSSAIYYLFEMLKYHLSGVNIEFLTAFFLLLCGCLIGVIISKLLSKK